MARRKTVAVTMPVARAIRSFEDWGINEVRPVPDNERLDALVRGGFLEVISSGSGEGEPGGTQPGDPEGEPQGPEAESAAGAAPGEDPGAG